MNTTKAAFYGKGIFSTIPIRGGEAFLWEKHWRRLTANAAKVGVDLVEHNERTTRESLDKAIATSGVREGRARITFFDDSPSEIWFDKIEQKTAFSIIVGERRVVPQPFKLTVSPHLVNSTSPLAGVKSCNYLENILALDEAKRRGFHEALRVNERGHITSGCMANVFWLKDDRVFTPALSTGCLAGTTREYVLENFDCEEVEASIAVLENADAIFLTSAGIGIVQASEFDRREFCEVSHPITDLPVNSVDSG